MGTQREDSVPGMTCGISRPVYTVSGHTGPLIPRWGLVRPGARAIPAVISSGLLLEQDSPHSRDTPGAIICVCVCVCVSHKAQNSSREIVPGLPASRVVGELGWRHIVLGAEQAEPTPELHLYSGQATSTFLCRKYCLMPSSPAGLRDKQEWSQERLNYVKSSHSLGLLSPHLSLGAILGPCV